MSGEQSLEVRGGLTARALIIATLLTIITGMWVKQVEMLKFTCQVTEATPPIPALAGLLILSALRLKRFRLTRGELGVIYVFLGLSSVAMSPGMIRQWLPCLTVPRYFEFGGRYLAEDTQLLPEWMAPADEEVTRQFFEGSDHWFPRVEWRRPPLLGPGASFLFNEFSATAAVPWGNWLAPTIAWYLFYLALFTLFFCMMSVLHVRWTYQDRVGYPLTQIPFEITNTPGISLAERPFFRNPLMWIGFSVAAAYDIFNIAHAFNPSVPALGDTYPVGSIFTERPWDALRRLTIWWRPELMGLAYLVPTDILFATWLFYFLEEFSRVFARAGGFEVAEFPYTMPQNVGAFIVFGVYLFWAARGPMRRAYRALWGREAWMDPDAPLHPRLAIPGIALSGLFLLVFLILGGIPVLTAILFWFLGVVFVVVYCRLRAEAGLPMVWGYPAWEQRGTPVALFGSRIWGPSKGSGLVMSATLMFLDNSLHHSMVASHLEGYKIGASVDVRRNEMFRVSMIAVVFGLAWSIWLHLTTYYEWGSLVTEQQLAFGATGGARTRFAYRQFEDVARWVTAPVEPDRARTTAIGIGAVVALILLALRHLFVRFPLHPLGFLIANCDGMFTFWPWAFSAWAVKSAILRLGGIKAFRRMIPLFLGLAIGHYVLAGMVYGVAALWGQDVFRYYIVWFS